MWVNPVGRFDHLLGTKAGMACIHFFGSEHTSLQTIHVLHLVIKPDVSHHEAGKTPFEVASENTKPNWQRIRKYCLNSKHYLCNPLPGRSWMFLSRESFYCCADILRSVQVFLRSRSVSSPFPLDHLVFHILLAFEPSESFNGMKCTVNGNDSRIKLIQNASRHVLTCLQLSSANLVA